MQGPLALWALPHHEPYPQFSNHHAQAKALPPSQDVAHLPAGIQLEDLLHLLAVP